MRNTRSEQYLLRYLFFPVLFFIFFFSEECFSGCSDYEITKTFCGCGWCRAYTGTCKYVGSSNGVCNYRGLTTYVPGTVNSGTIFCKTQYWAWTPPCSTISEPCTGCSACTPSPCPAGYQETPTGTLCTTSTSQNCNKLDSCNKVCGTESRNCYPVETNTSVIPTPSTNTLTIDSRATNVASKSSQTPTLVPLPLTSATPISTSVNSIPNPTGSRGLIYNFNINNVPTSQSTSMLSNKPLATSLTQGSVGSIQTSYSTLNKCDNNVKTGPSLKTYYKVNTLPTVESLSISGEDTNSGTTTQGCTASPSYTGQGANNPLVVKVKGSDADGTNTINGMFLWIVKEGQNIPGSYLNKRYTVGPGASKNTKDMIGLFFGMGGNATSKWVSVYKAVIENGNLTGWGRDADASNASQTYVKDSGGKTLIGEIEAQYPTIENGKITFEVKLTFPEDSEVLGKYKFYASMTDTLSYYKIGTNTYTELRPLTTQPEWTWNFDFVKPTISNLKGTVYDQRQATVMWESSDDGSGIKDTVVNVYNEKSGKKVKRTEPKPEDSITVSKTPDDSGLIGKITNPISSGWHYSSPISSTKIDILENDSGKLQFYISVYDKACNRTTSNATDSPSFDLNRWIVTKGGILFSKGSINYIAKKIEPNPEEYNLGTELITTTNTSKHPVVINWDVLKNPTSVINVTDGNTLEPNRFDLLRSKLERYKQGLTKITSLGECSGGTVCILESSESISIAPIEYRGKIIVVSDKDIIVDTDITASNSLKDGLILFAGGNIIVSSTSRTTKDTLYYDQVDAFMIAREQIQISKEVSNLQDGVKVLGSLISFAKNNKQPGLLLQRDLGLLNVTNPVLIVNYHPKYAKISEIFFGKDNSAYKQEVGFKIL